MEEFCSALQSQSIPEVCETAESVVGGEGLTPEAPPSSFWGLVTEGLGKEGVVVAASDSAVLISTGRAFGSTSLCSVSPPLVTTLMSATSKDLIRSPPVLTADPLSLTPSRTVVLCCTAVAPVCATQLSSERTSPGAGAAGGEVEAVWSSVWGLGCVLGAAAEG